jgi:hypothetical protein
LLHFAIGNPESFFALVEGYKALELNYFWVKNENRPNIVGWCGEVTWDS